MFVGKILSGLIFYAAAAVLGSEVILVKDSLDKANLVDNILMTPGPLESKKHMRELVESIPKNFFEERFRANKKVDESFVQANNAHKRAILIELFQRGCFGPSKMTQLLVLPSQAASIEEAGELRVAYLGQDEWNLLNNLAQEIHRHAVLMPLLDLHHDKELLLVSVLDDRGWSQTGVARSLRYLWKNDLSGADLAQGLRYASLIFVMRQLFDERAWPKEYGDEVRDSQLDEKEQLLLDGIVRNPAYGGVLKVMNTLIQYGEVSETANGVGPHILAEPEKGIEKGKTEMGEDGHESPGGPTPKP